MTQVCERFRNEKIGERELSDTQARALMLLEEEAEKIAGPFFTREGLVDFSNGAISAGYLKNLDSLGQGPEGAVYLGRKRAYPKKNAIMWLAKRITGGC